MEISRLFALVGIAIARVLIFWKVHKNDWLGRLIAGSLATCAFFLVYLFLVSFTMDDSLCSSSSKRQARAANAPFLTYIMFSVANRFNFTKSIFDTRLPGFFNASHRYCVPQNDSRMYANGGLGAGSLMLSYIDLWREIGSKPDSELADDDWIFLFEDDVDIIPWEILRKFYPKLFLKWSRIGLSQALADTIKRGLQLAEKDGVLYLGTCSPQYPNNTTKIEYAFDDLVQYRRGIYYCTHAIAYTKWRIKTLWDELATYRMINPDLGADTIARTWQILSKKHPFSVGSNIEWPVTNGHFGFFYQARGIFKSTIHD